MYGIKSILLKLETTLEPRLIITLIPTQTKKQKQKPKPKKKPKQKNC